MADHDQMRPGKRGVDEKPRPETAGRPHTGVDQEKELHRGSTPPGGTVGRTVPDHSKERNTEIAVEAGRKGGEHSDDKR